MDDNNFFDAPHMPIMNDLDLGLAPVPPSELLAEILGPEYASRDLLEAHLSRAPDGGQDLLEAQMPQAPDGVQDLLEAQMPQAPDGGQDLLLEAHMSDAPDGDQVVQDLDHLMGGHDDDEDLQLLLQLQQHLQPDAPPEHTEEHEPRESPKDQDSANVPPLRFEIAFPSIPDEIRDEYEEIFSGTVERVIGSVGSGQYGRLYQIELTDGREDMLSIDQLLDLRNGRRCLFDYRERRQLAASRRRQSDFSKDGWDGDSSMEDGVSDRMDLDDLGEEEDEDEDEDDNDDEDDDGVDDPLMRSSSGPRGRSLRSRGPRSGRSQQRGPAESDDDDDDDDDDGDDEDESTPQASRPSRNLRKREPKQLLLSEMEFNTPVAIQDGEPDELALDAERPIEEEDDADDFDFLPVISDLAAQKKGRLRRLKTKSKRLQSARAARSSARRRGGGDDDESDIEFERPRRSARATKNATNMLDDMDDDSLYVADDRSPAVPKVVSIREVFPPISAESSFGSRHMQYCQTCNNPKKSDQLLYCQGCSSAFHRYCIGYRSGRDHQATKVGHDNFVLQCRFCIGVHKKKDEHAPSHSKCQECKQHGPSCAAFSPKKTTRQEEKMREENGGVDPITPVPERLINNADNVLFRCTTCYRAWHHHHLPWTKLDSVETDINEEDHRPKKHSRDWRCEDCNSTEHKIQRLVAWRPVTKPDTQAAESESESTGFEDYTEDDKEYLVKWQNQSHAHCTWMSGAWIYGVAAGSMRNSFAKHASYGDLLKRTTEEAIPDEYLIPDVIFNVKMAAHAPKGRSRHEDLANISNVAKIFVKFQGLGYDDAVWDSVPTPDKPDMYNAFVEGYREYLAGKYFRIEPHSKIRDRIRAYKNEAFEELDFQPDGLKRGKLMGYQMEGLNWLLQNYHQGRNIVLADEMGLGKTVQCWPFLIVVPNSTCPNWRREFKQWAPDIRVVTYHGGKESQELAYKYELFPNGSADMRAQVVIMSYDSASDQRTQSLFKSVSWAGLVVDEGQRLKNEQSLLYLALRAMKIPFRLLLTGTPLQNNKRELFNLLQFIDETQKAAKLDEQFEVLDKETLPQLHNKIRPYFLRRTKAGVLKFLPPMAQIILPVTMTVIQQKLSKSIIAKNPQLIKAVFANTKMAQKERGALNNILMQLRKCLCHPFMYSDAIEERDHDPLVVHRNLVEASAKLLLLELMLPKLKERGHRVLIFSQFLQQLDIVEDFLIGMGVEFRRLDGSISSLEKQRRIDAFNEEGSQVFAFLLSTRAGGVGINLATADTVIIMDPDFNPHQDIQALSRAHRIGQKNKVLCFQLVTKDSVEEQIMQVGRKKMALDHALIESMDDDELAGDDLESILKRGAQALFDENYEKAAIQYDSAAVDKLLDRSQVEQTATNEEGSAETQFTYARVWSNEKGGFEENQNLGEEQAPEPISSSVWDQILAQREEEARRVAEANREELGRGARRRTAINYKTDPANQAGEAPGSSDSDSSDEFSAKSQDESDDEDQEDTRESPVDLVMPDLPGPPAKSMPKKMDDVTKFQLLQRKSRSGHMKFYPVREAATTRQQAAAASPASSSNSRNATWTAGKGNTPSLRWTGPYQGAPPPPPGSAPMQHPSMGNRIIVQPPTRPLHGQRAVAMDYAAYPIPPPNAAASGSGGRGAVGARGAAAAAHAAAPPPVPTFWQGGAQNAAPDYPQADAHAAPRHRDSEFMPASRREIEFRLAMDSLSRAPMPEVEKRMRMERLQRQVWELGHKRGR